MIDFSVNGKAVAVDVDDDTPLLWTLRETLQMTGTKFGCGMALCGACTVHLDGQPMRSCVTPASSGSGRKVTTIEGIGGTPVGKAVQRPGSTLDVPQCGYCQSGQIMSAGALLAENRSPTDADIDSAMSGNICRCGTYNAHPRGDQGRGREPVEGSVTWTSARPKPRRCAIPRADAS